MCGKNSSGTKLNRRSSWSDSITGDECLQVSTCTHASEIENYEKTNDISPIVPQHKVWFSSTKSVGINIEQADMLPLSYVHRNSLRILVLFLLHVRRNMLVAVLGFFLHIQNTKCHRLVLLMT
jgi:hypothetical protein